MMFGGLSQFGPGGSTGVRPSVAGRGFSFVELLFAVGVLGIGFIMLAAIFPVGLQQTKLTIDETAAAANARGAAVTVAQIASRAVEYTRFNIQVAPVSPLPAPLPQPTAAEIAVQPNGTTKIYPGDVRSFRDPRDFGTAANVLMHGQLPGTDTMWARVGGESINKGDPRNASVVLYKRDWLVTKDATGGTTITARPLAQLMVINTQVANASAYTRDDTFQNLATPPLLYNLEPRLIGVQITWDQNEKIYLATFTSITAGYGNSIAEDAGMPPLTANQRAMYDTVPSAVAEGSFVVISNDRFRAKTAAAQPDLHGRFNGYIFRVGVQRPDLPNSPWQLAPGYEFTHTTGADGVEYSGAALPNPGAIKDDVYDIGVDGLVTSNFNGVTYDPRDVKIGTVNGKPAGAVAFIIGRGFVDPKAIPAGLGTPNNGAYAGPTQDVSVYTTFVPVE